MLIAIATNDTIDTSDTHCDDDRLGDLDCDSEQYMLFYLQSILPCQNRRILRDVFTSAIDWVVESNQYNDIQEAAWHYSNLVEATKDLPNNQAKFWNKPAGDYLSLFWTAWMHWLEEWDNRVPSRLDS